MAELVQHRLELGEPRLGERQPAARFVDQAIAARDGVAIAVDADHLRVRGCKDRAAVAAGTERAVDVNTTVARLEKFDRGASEHGNMTGRSASDMIAAA